jgi:hypothetical protein
LSFDYPTVIGCCFLPVSKNISHVGKEFAGTDQPPERGHGVHARGLKPRYHITDLQKLSSDYKYAAKHPMVGDPWSRAVFDPLQMAVLPAPGLVELS